MTVIVGDRGYVKPWGDPTCKIAIVGEAPGAIEAREGIPFAPNAPAGSLLAQCMQHAGMTRRECYINNVFKRQVTKSGANYKLGDDIVYVSGRGFTPKGLVWVEQLKQELSQTAANVIVVMGECAIHALLGLFKPTKVRGSLYQSDFIGPHDKRKVLCAIHPAACLHQQAGEDGGSQFAWRYFIIYDLMKAKREAATREYSPPQCKFHVRPTFNDCVATLRRFKHQYKVLTVDIEVYNQEISCVGIGTDKEVLVVPFTLGREDYWKLDEECLIWRCVEDIISDPKIMKVYHNGLFDMSVMMQKNHIVPAGPVFDTMVAFRQCYADDQFKKSLDVLASLYTKWPYYKEELKIWTTRQLDAATHGDISVLWQYNAKDVAATHESMLALIDEMEAQGNRAIFDTTMKLYPALLYMMIRGIKADLTDLQKLKEQLEVREAELQLELNKLAGEELNPRSAVQLKAYFYTKLGIPPYYDRKTKAVTVDDDALKSLARGTQKHPGRKEASLIREIRGISKLKGTYLEISFSKDKRLRCSINPVGTKNGRLSTSKTLFGEGTNMQNLPQQFKRFLRHDPGRVMIEMDKTQGEWVIVAYVSGDANMMAVAASRADAHAATGSMSFGVPIDLIKKESKLVGNETDPRKLLALRKEYIPEILEFDIPGVMSVRQAGKKSNHGLNYDMGYKTFAKVNEVPETEAKRIVAAYHAGYPGIRAHFHAFIKAELGRTRTLVNLFGRKRRFWGEWGDALFKDGYAFIPQSSLVDLVNEALIKMYNDPKIYMKYIDLLMQVHDSVLFQYILENYRYNRLAVACIRSRQHLEPVLNWQGREFVIDTDMKMGFNWAGYHAERNPTGMIEVKFSRNQTEMADRLEVAHKMLLENERNLEVGDVEGSEQAADS